jgi:hypothetical protein
MVSNASSASLRRKSRRPDGAGAVELIASRSPLDATKIHGIVIDEPFLPGQAGSRIASYFRLGKGYSTHVALRFETKFLAASLELVPRTLADFQAILPAASTLLLTRVTSAFARSIPNRKAKATFPSGRVGSQVAWRSGIV